MVSPHCFISLDSVKSIYTFDVYHSSGTGLHQQ